MRKLHSHGAQLLIVAALAVSASACSPAWRGGDWNQYGAVGPGMMWGSPFMGAFSFLGTFLAVLAALFVFRWLTDGGKRYTNALDALKTRYAKGEVSREDYERMKKELGV